MRKLRVLALHSFRTSGDIFRQQVKLSGLDEKLEDLIEIVYLTAPHPASGAIPDDVKDIFEGPYFEWWTADKGEGGEWTYQGAEQSVAYVSDYLRLHGPFDGLVGFSQGGAMAAILVAMQRHGAALQGLPLLRFCVIFAGIKSRDPRFVRFLDQPIACPALHVIGDRDYVKKYAYQLYNAFEEPCLITHPRGHVIPRLQGEQLEALRSFLERFQQPDSHL